MVGVDDKLIGTVQTRTTHLPLAWFRFLYFAPTHFAGSCPSLAVCGVKVPRVMKSESFGHFAQPLKSRLLSCILRPCFLHRLLATVNSASPSDIIAQSTLNAVDRVTLLASGESVAASLLLPPPPHPQDRSKASPPRVKWILSFHVRFLPSLPITECCPTPFHATLLCGISTACFWSSCSKSTRMV